MSQYDKFSYVSSSGKKISGASAYMNTVKKSGGPDEYTKQIALEYITEFVNDNPEIIDIIAKKYRKDTFRRNVIESI